MLQYVRKFIAFRQNATGRCWPWGERLLTTILTIGYHLLQRGMTYYELGGDYFDRRNAARTAKRLVKRLEALGYGVILEPNHNPAAA